MRLAQHRGDMLGVLDAGGEDEAGLAVAGLIDDFGAGGAHENIIIHEVLDLIGDELAAADMQSGGIGLGLAGLADQRRQEAVADEFLDPNLVTDVVEDVLGGADRPILEPERRRREADHAQVRVHHPRLAQECLVHALAVRGDEVGLVDEHDVEAAQVAGLLVHRLNAGDDDRMVEIAALEPSRVDPDQQVGQETTGLAGVLVHQLLHMRQHQDAAVPALHDIGAQAADDHALAATCGDYDAGVVGAGSQVLVDGGDRRFLVRTQCDHQATCARRG